MVGQGAFGVVYQCNKDGDSRNFAVKMIDKVETPLEKIVEESELQQTLDHDNIVKIHEVFYEKCFVCIVMDILEGGDLLSGILHYMRKKGLVPCHRTGHVTQQMLDAICFLHGKGIVHRDIKGENYLIDREEVVDPFCRVVLSDFGTAARTKGLDARLSDTVGTSIYWAPEVFDGDYGAKVDVWAVGVVVYCIVAGRMPFKGEKEIKSGEVKWPTALQPPCANFIEHLLHKDEEHRYTANQARAHPWLVTTVRQSLIYAGLDPEFTLDEGDLREGAPNFEVGERRKQLIERYKRAAGMKKSTSQGYVNVATSCSSFYEPRFCAKERRAQRTRVFEWWPEPRAREEGLLTWDGFSPGRARRRSIKHAQIADSQIVTNMLQEHGIDTTVFGQGKAKHLFDFVLEVQGGASRLMLDAAEHKKLVRVVDVVLLRLDIVRGDERVFLVQSSETYQDGRTRKCLNRLPGTKKEPHENNRTAAARVIRDMLGMGDCEIYFSFKDKEVYEDETDSPSYPGVNTVYRKEIIPGQILTNDPAVLRRIAALGDAHSGEAETPRGWSHLGVDQLRREFEWMTEERCDSECVELRAPDDGYEVSGLVRAPTIGMDGKTLEKYLEDHGIDCDKTLGDGRKRLDALSMELIKGESSLVHNHIGEVCRIVDDVLLVLRDPHSGRLIVEVEEAKADGTTTDIKRLPGGRRRPDENQFATAKRVLRKQMHIDPDYVDIVANTVRVLEQESESPSFPGLLTLYRKRIISANIRMPHKEEDHRLDVWAFVDRAHSWAAKHMKGRESTLAPVAGEEQPLDADAAEPDRALQPIASCLKQAKAEPQQAERAENANPSFADEVEAPAADEPEERPAAELAASLMSSGRAISMPVQKVPKPAYSRVFTCESVPGPVHALEEGPGRRPSELWEELPVLPPGDAPAAAAACALKPDGLPDELSNTMRRLFFALDTERAGLVHPDTFLAVMRQLAKQSEALDEIDAAAFPSGGIDIASFQQELRELEPLFGHQRFIAVLRGLAAAGLGESGRRSTVLG